MITHKESNHNQLQHPCNICDYNAKDGDDLTEHTGSIHKAQSYSCDKCDFKTSQKTNLKTHTNLLHNKKENQNQNEPTIVDFIKRMRSENEGTKNTDEVSDDITSTQNMIIDARARKQSKDVSLKCDNCKFETRSITLFKKHTNGCTKTLENELENETTKKKSKRIHCDKCIKKFNKESTYKSHMKNTHGVPAEESQKNRENEYTTKNMTFPTE